LEGYDIICLKMAVERDEQCYNENMTLQDFKIWSEEALKHFLGF